MAAVRNTYKVLFFLLLTAGAGLYLNARHHHHRQQHPALVAHHFQKTQHHSNYPSSDPGLSIGSFRVESPHRGCLIIPAASCGNHLSLALPASSTRGPPTV